MIDAEKLYARIVEQNDRYQETTLRDDFAKAALTGLLASSTSMGYDACVAAAYRIADMMLEARK